ncbi:MAG TPA: DUF1801 domain-containing protein, partial [Coriobacteriia bacterium]|nr:DUF1801 domain-containing protein [Coriobacteriia bacterium]
PHKWGGSLIRNLIDGEFAGPIYPVNGRGGTVCGLPAFASIGELPTVPDLALIALGADKVNDVIEQCGEGGIPVALVVAAGYSEAGEAGAALEAELVMTARASGVTLIGPNCMGLLATHSRLHAVGFLELRPQAGALSIVSQSGNIGVQLVTRAERRGVGIDKYVTVGNQASTSALDVLDALGDDAQTATALVYLEGTGDGRRFLDVMRRITPKKPVVVLRGGLTEYGRRAAASHTGAMAGAADVFMAAAHQAGCLVRTGPDESLDLALCLTALPLPAGRRVAIMTLGGGWGVLAADELARNDLELAPLEPQVLAALDELLPGYWSRSNPIDLVAAIDPDLAERTLTVLAESEMVDAVVVLGILRSPSTGWTSDAAPAVAAAGFGRGSFNPAETAFLERVSELMERTGKPIINVPLRPFEAATFPTAARHDPVILYAPVAAVRALAAMAWYREYVAVHSDPPPRQTADTFCGPGSGVTSSGVDEQASYQWMIVQEARGMVMNPSEQIDNLIAQNPDWRGATLAKLRRIILEVDPEIVEEWKYMGAPVWSLNGIICVGNIFKDKVKLGFMHGAALSDPDELFNGELAGNQRRAIELHQGDDVDEGSLKTLVRAAISYNQAKKK